MTPVEATPSDPALLTVATRVLDITPDRALDMGSGPRRDRVELDANPVEPLEANIALIRAGAEPSNMLLLVSLDTLYPGPDLRQAIEDAAADLAPEQIFIGASHTHRAPMTATSWPTLGSSDPEYVDSLKKSLQSAVSQLLKDDAGTAVEVWAGSGEASHSINRRRKKWFFLAKRPRWNFVANAPNSRGVTDEIITTIEFRTMNGEVAAYVWNYACHPVSHPNPATYSSHFPGAIREQLRTRHPEAPVLFFQGFSGNTRPSASARVRQPKEWIRRLLSGPIFDDMTWRRYRRWTETLASVVEQSMASATREQALPLVLRRRQIDGARLAEGSRPLTLHSIRLGKDIQIVGVSAEPVAEYARLVRSWAPAPYLMCVGCIDEPVGYIPTDNMIAEGGYESDRSRSHFGVGAYSLHYQATIENSLRDVADKNI